MRIVELCIKILSIFAISFSIIFIVSGLNEKINFSKNIKYNLCSSILLGIGASFCIYVSNEYFSVHYMDGKLLFILTSCVLNSTMGGIITSTIIIIFGIYGFSYFGYSTVISIIIAIIIGTVLKKKLIKAKKNDFDKSFFLVTSISILAYIILIYAFNKNHKQFSGFRFYNIIPIVIVLAFSYFICKSIQNRMEKMEYNIRFKLISKVLNNGIWDYNIQTEELYLSDRIFEIYGLTKKDKEFMRKNYENLIYPEDLTVLKGELKKLYDGKQNEFSIEIRILHNKKGFVWVMIKCIIKRDDNNKLARIAGSYEEINIKKSQEKQLKLLSRYDVLTGLPNRTHFFYRISQNIAKDGEGAVIYIDVDNFKNINDNLGHSYGDALLIEIAERLSLYENEKCFISRLGGDEFIIILEGELSKNKIKEYSETILKSFEKAFKLNNTEFIVTISMGIAFYPEQGYHGESLLMNADTAMYKAKGKGKNCYEIFDENMNRENLERLNMENSLRKTIKENGFTLYYQPQFSAKDKELIGFEALIRWFDGEKGMIPTMDFILLAEQTGLIIDIGKWVLEEACKFSTAINSKQNKAITVSVNVSSLQLNDNNFEESVYEIVNRTSADPKRISIEITETALMESFDKNCDKIKKLRNMGFQISLDDFGTGYSSLNYLREIPVTEIKIDKSFIDDICEDERQRMLTKAIINISHDLKLKVVAEGVETEEQLSVLQKMNCDYIQGYLLGKPENEEKNIMLLERQA